MADKLVRLTLRDLSWAGGLLGKAFMDDPLLTYVIPDARRRITRGPWFVRASLSYGIRYGEAHAPPGREGVAFFLPPNQTTLTPARMFRAGMLAAPLRLGLSGFGRFMTMADFTDKLHKQHAPMPHYYLFGMGVDPSEQGKGVGSRLLAAVLRRSEGAGVPCYLETQNARNVPFYEKHGFRVVTDAELPGGGLRSWGMLHGLDS